MSRLKPTKGALGHCVPYEAYLARFGNVQPSQHLGGWWEMPRTRAPTPVQGASLRLLTRRNKTR